MVALEVVEFVFSGCVLNTSARVLPVFGQLDFARENLLYDWSPISPIVEQEVAKANSN